MSEKNIPLIKQTSLFDALGNNNDAYHDTLAAVKAFCEEQGWKWYRNKTNAGETVLHIHFRPGQITFPRSLPRLEDLLPANTYSRLRNARTVGKPVFRILLYWD